MKPEGFLYGLYRRSPVAVQNVLVSLFGGRRWRHEKSSEFQSRVDHLMDSQFFSAEEMEKIRRESLARILLSARNTSYYSGILPGEGEILNDPFSVLLSVPVLDREEVRRDPQAFVNREYRGPLIQHGTSGTTGTPLHIYWTPECVDMERALIWRQRRQTGLDIGKCWRGMLGGHRIVPLNQEKPPFWRANRPAKQLYFSTYHLSPMNASHYLRALEDYDVRALEGYPSVLFALAHTFSRNHLRYELQGVYYGAEPLLDFQRKTIEEVFGCYVWDYYGLTERTASASEFECRNGLHENWENCVLEVVDSVGDSLPTGEYGELVGTSLCNHGFPLLRYRTGDMTRFLEGTCTCGRHSRRIDRIDTKREDLIVTPEGTLLSASNLTYPFKEVRHIIESQICQDSPGRLEIRIVPADDYSDKDGERLLEGIGNMIPDSMEVVLVKVDSIPRTDSGKYRFCVSRISREELPEIQD